MALCIEVPYLSSLNKTYAVKSVYSRKWGKRIPRITKNEESSVLQKQVIIRIRNMGLGDYCRSTYAYTCETRFLAPEDYWLTLHTQALRKKDLTNFWKIVEDGIAEGLGMDDSQCIQQTQYKDFLEDNDSIMKIVFSAKTYNLQGN